MLDNNFTPPSMFFDERLTNLDDMVNLKDIITIAQQQRDNQLRTDINKKIIEYAQYYDILLNEEKVNKWIQQSIEIETFTPKQLENFKYEIYLRKRDEIIKEQAELIKELTNKLHEIEQLCLK